MILYLDASAVVKLYVRETGSREVKKLARESAALATSVVAYALRGFDAMRTAAERAGLPVAA